MENINILLGKLSNVKKLTNNSWIASCPCKNHGKKRGDKNPSLSITIIDNKILVHCHAGCYTEEVLKSIGFELKDLFITTQNIKSKSKITLKELSAAKGIPEKVLKEYGVIQQDNYVLIQYFNSDKTLAKRHRIRKSIIAKEGSLWSDIDGDIIPYGLWKQHSNAVHIVEGESDCWTLWLHNLNAIGIPGATMINTLKEKYINNYEKVIIVQENDPAGIEFVKNIVKKLKEFHFKGEILRLSIPAGVKDTNELYLKDRESFAHNFLDEKNIYKIKTKKDLLHKNIMTKNFQETKWIIPNLIPEGLTILAGKPKAGKSFLALNLSLAISSGGKVLNSLNVEKKGVLYLALEDSFRRIQERCFNMYPDEKDFEKYYLKYVDMWETLPEGLFTLRKYLEDDRNIKLVIIDTFATFRGCRPAGYIEKNLYQSDYSDMSMIKYIADELEIAIILIHHTRKEGAINIFDTVSGTLGLTGAADVIMVLDRKKGETEAKLHVTGRDIEEQDLLLEFDKERTDWKLKSDNKKFEITTLKEKIWQSLTDDIFTTAEIMKKINLNYVTINSTLIRLCKENKIRKIAYGKYQKNV